MNRRWPAILALLLVTMGRMAHAQPCARYRALPLPRAELASFIASMRADLATAGDSSQPASIRIVAATRAADRVSQAHRRYGLCNRPTAADDRRVRAALGLPLSDPQELQQRAWQACVAAVASSHASGPEARACIDHVEPAATTVRFLVPAAPNAWRALNTDDSAAWFARTRTTLAGASLDHAARMTVATVQLASADFDGAISTLAPLPATDLDAALVRAAAQWGRGDAAEATRRFFAIAHAAPQRADAHLDIAIAVAARRSDPNARPMFAAAFDHARAYVCIAHETLGDADADAATELVRTLDEALHDGDSAWGFRGNQPPLPLPVEMLGPGARRTFTSNQRVRDGCATVLSRVSAE